MKKQNGNSLSQQNEAVTTLGNTFWILKISSLIVIGAVIYNFVTIEDVKHNLEKVYDIFYTEIQSDSGHSKSQKIEPPAAPIPSPTKRTLFRPSVSQQSINFARFLNELETLTLEDFYPLNANGSDSNLVALSSIDSFNNAYLGPRLQVISRMDYFRYVKLNLSRKCTLWPDNTKCSLK